MEKAILQMKNKFIKSLFSIYLLQLVIFGVVSTIPVNKSLLPEGYSIMIYKGNGGIWSCIPIFGYIGLAAGGFDAWVYDINSNSAYVVQGFDSIGDIDISKTTTHRRVNGLVEIKFGSESEHIAIFKY
jgi:hypothetical protein